jgi:uncharacterized membrane protein YgcG
MFSSVTQNAFQWLKWPFGVAIFLTSRIFLVNFLKLFMCTSLIFSSQLNNLLHSNHITTTQWVIDEEQLLNPRVAMSIAQVLDASAQNKEMNVRLLIVKDASEFAKAKAKHKTIEWDNRQAIDQQNKSLYLVLNIATNESYLFAPDKVQSSKVLQDSILGIQQNIIAPALQTGQFHNAAREGIVALVTVIEQWPGAVKPSIFFHINAWLHQYYLMLPLQILLGLAILLGAGVMLRRYMNRPNDWSLTYASAQMSLEEQMFLNSIAYKNGQNGEFKGSHL